MREDSYFDSARLSFALIVNTYPSGVPLREGRGAKIWIGGNIRW